MKTVSASMDVKELQSVVNNVGAGFKNSANSIILANVAALTLVAEDSGATIVLDRAAGCDVTLPAALPGLEFDVVVKTSVTSNDYSLNGAAATDLFVGGIISNDTDTSGAAVHFSPDGSDDDVMSMNGSTTGGLIGSSFKLRCVQAARWLITGTNRGSGTVATPFA